MDIKEIVAMIVQMVLVPLLIWGLSILRNYLLSKAQAEQIRGAILLADSAIQAAVGEAGQTFVDSIKSQQGELTKEQAAEAFQMAYSRALDILGQGGLALLESTTADAHAYITAKIEEEVRKTRENYLVNSDIVIDDDSGWGLTD